VPIKPPAGAFLPSLSIQCEPRGLKQIRFGSILRRVICGVYQESHFASPTLAGNIASQQELLARSDQASLSDQARGAEGVAVTAPISDHDAGLPQ
jgi:hypothetical protein